MSIQKYKAKLEASQLLTEHELSNLAETAVSILVQEPTVVQVSGDQYIVGDIHGQFYDLLKLTREVVSNQSEPSIVFLGDYVDRGYHSIETICYMLCLKCISPSRVIMLRGNHETSSLTRIYGFYDQVHKKYGNHNPWMKIVEVFTYLPLCAIVSNKIICIHGGLSPSTPFVDDIASIDRVKQIPQTGPLCDLVWSDPENGDREGWFVNNRGAGYIFSKQIAHQFLYLNGLLTIVRAHQLVEQGHTYNFGDQSFVTVWSAPNYCYRCGNDAAVMKVDSEGGKSFIKFSSSQETNSRKIHYEHILPYFL